MSDSKTRESIQLALSKLLTSRAMKLGNKHPDFSGLRLAANIIRNQGRQPFRSLCQCGCHRGILLCEGCCVPDEPESLAYLEAIDAARQSALEEAAKVCEKLDDEYGRHANLVVAADAIRSLANPAERPEGEKT